MFGLTKSAISAMPILSFIADFREMVQFGNGKLPNSRFRHCRNSLLPKKYLQGPFVIDNLLFDWKTAHIHNSLNNSVFLIDFKASTDLAPSQLFPFWKQLEQSGSFIQIENSK